MNKIKHQHYLNKEKLASYELDFFVEVVLKRLGRELERLTDNIFNYKDISGKKRKPTVYEDIFGLNEQAWVGLLNNAIIRSFPEADTLLEFTVYNDSNESEIRKFHGRADLLVHWKNNQGKSIYLLFEAKQFTDITKGDYNDVLNKTKDKNYHDDIKNQAKKYIKADEDYFSKKTIVIIPIIFGWIKDSSTLTNAKKYMKSIDEKKEHFCSLYFEKDRGAWVYGSVFNSKGEELINV
jgi:hypothetical protein